MAMQLAEAVSGLVADGVLDYLPRDVRFNELSESRMGSAADVELAESLVVELRARGLAKRGRAMAFPIDFNRPYGRPSWSSSHNSRGRGATGRTYPCIVQPSMSARSSMRLLDVRLCVQGLRMP